MSSSSTARPPRPNNVPDVRLGDPRVEAFLNKATGEGEGPAPQTVAPPAPAPAAAGAPAPMGLPAAGPLPAQAFGPPPLAPSPHYVPSPAPQKEMMRPWTMRLPPDIHSNLKWIAENGGPSMNEFILQALRDALPSAIEKLTRAQAMGLSLKRGRGS